MAPPIPGGAAPGTLRLNSDHALREMQLTFPSFGHLAEGLLSGKSLLMLSEN